MKQKIMFQEASASGHLLITLAADVKTDFMNERILVKF
jgi:hypothetical protein